VFVSNPSVKKVDTPQRFSHCLQEQNGSRK
jgi:hypothetical protein